MFGVIFLFVLSVAGAQPVPTLYEDNDQQRISGKIEENLHLADIEDAPGAVQFLFGEPKVNLLVDSYAFGFFIDDGKAKGFQEEGLRESSYLILMTEESLDRLIAGEDAGQMYKSGEIAVHANGFWAGIKLWLANILEWLFGKRVPEPWAPNPTENDTDGDYMTDKFEFTWEFDPKRWDENRDGVIDGFNDNDGDGWMSGSEDKGGSNPKDKNDVPKNKTCTIDCCCDVYLQQWGTCGDYGRNAPKQLGPYNWTPSGKNVQSGGSVEGYHSYLYLNDNSGVYRCYDLIVYKYTFNAAGDQCDNKYDFCKTAIGKQCKQHEQTAASEGSAALQQCVSDVKKNCKGRFSQYTQNNNVAGTC